MCKQCQHIFCTGCIDEWIKTNKFCPFKCEGKNDMQFIKLPNAVTRMYENLLVSCSKPNCEEIIPLKDLFQHENCCGVQKCENYEKCQNYAPLLILDKRVCSEKCYIHESLKNGEKIEDKILYNLVKNFIENISNDIGRIRTFHCFWEDKHLEKAKQEEIEEGEGLKIDQIQAMVTNTSESKCYKSAVGAYVRTLPPLNI